MAANSQALSNESPVSGESDGVLLCVINDETLEYPTSRDFELLMVCFREAGRILNRYHCLRSLIEGCSVKSVTVAAADY